MPSYDVRGGKLIGAPPSFQKSWDEFQGAKAPMSSAKDYRADAAANPKQWQKDAQKNVFKR